MNGMDRGELSPFNLSSMGSKVLPKRVTIYDSTLRDGEQMPGVAFRHAEKLEIAEMLAGIGISQIEAGFPAVSAQERETVKSIGKLGLASEILALSRTCKTDIDAAIDCDVDMIMLFTASSDLHLKHKYRITREQQRSKVIESLEHARSHGLRFSFSTEDSTRTDLDYILELSNMAESMGASRIGISDTTGCISPPAIGKLIGIMSGRVKVPLSVHLHNDFGLALANALASVENGATAVASTVNGMGERAGNVPTEALAVAMEKMYGIDTGIDLSGLTRVCRRVSEISGVPLSRNHPWVGHNAFRHEAGIHVAAILSNPATYECIMPEVVGGRREMILGKHSGKTSLVHRLESLGLHIADDEIPGILLMVKEFAQNGRPIDDGLLLELARMKELNI